MSTAKCLISGSWYTIECYKKDNHWYNTHTDEQLSNYDIYWIE